ncbi:MAG: hypothetical protein D3904_11760, partial [Candidatus Electrothrix sp. EH2]|nr:hypothetical protein [Candidatus Electrothrix sp. EH2]
MMYPEESVAENSHQVDSKPLIDRIHVVLKRKQLVITVAMIIFLTTALFTYSKTPVYTATTQVLVEKNQEKGRLEGLAPYMRWDPDFKATQFELIRSFNVALRVVKNQHLDTEYKQYFLGAPPTRSGIANRITAFFSDLASSVKKFFLSVVKFEQISGLSAPSEEEGQEKIAVRTGEKSDAEKIAAMIQGALTLAPVRDTKIVNVSYTHRVPEIAQLVADGVVQAYTEETLEIKTSTTRNSLKWMTVKADEERRKLEDSERALQEYMRKHDIVTVENKLAILPERLSEFSAKLSAAQAEEKKYAAVYSQIRKAGKKSKKLESIPLLADNSELQTLRSEVFT